MTKEQIKTEKKYYIRCLKMCAQDVFREPKRGISRERFRMRSYYKSAYKILLNELERSEYYQGHFWSAALWEIDNTTFLQYQNRQTYQNWKLWRILYITVVFLSMLNNS